MKNECSLRATTKIYNEKSVFEKILKKNQKIEKVLKS